MRSLVILLALLTVAAWAPGQEPPAFIVEERVRIDDGSSSPSLFPWARGVRIVARRQVDQWAFDLDVRLGDGPVFTVPGGMVAGDVAADRLLLFVAPRHPPACFGRPPTIQFYDGRGHLRGTSTGVVSGLMGYQVAGAPGGGIYLVDSVPAKAGLHELIALDGRGVERWRRNLPSDACGGGLTSLASDPASGSVAVAQYGGVTVFTAAGGVQATLLQGHPCAGVVRFLDPERLLVLPQGSARWVVWSLGGVPAIVHDQGTRTDEGGPWYRDAVPLPDGRFVIVAVTAAKGIVLEGWTGSGACFARSEFTDHPFACERADTLHLAADGRLVLVLQRTGGSAPDTLERLVLRLPGG